MATEVVVPQIGEAVSELTLVAWVKQEGEAVRRGDVLFEVDSDKAVVEVEAFVDGTLTEILVQAGGAVMPQQVVARIADENSISAFDKESTVAKPEAQEASPVLSDFKAPVTENAAVPGQRVLASPKARRTAREQGLDLQTLKGTGVNGMVTSLDIEAAMQAGAVRTPDPQVESPLTTEARGDLSKLQRAVAARTTQSKQTVPHFYLMTDVEMTEASKLREHCLDAGWERAPTYTALLVRAGAVALRDMPQLNQSYVQDRFLKRSSVNVGVAVNTDQGLTVPVIKNVDQLPLKTVANALGALAGRARQGRLKAEDFGDKSLTISNLGSYGVDTFIAIIDVPDPMILAVGRVDERAVVRDGKVVSALLCTLTLSADHRVLDGVQGAEFLASVKAHLEHPYALMGG